VSRTLAFKSRLLHLEVFEVNILEILKWLALYSMIGRLEISKRTKLNKTEQQSEDNQQYDARARYALSL
jgi:hypothetical protein